MRLKHVTELKEMLAVPDKTPSFGYFENENPARFAVVNLAGRRRKKKIRSFHT